MPYPSNNPKLPWIGQVRVNGVKRRKSFKNKKTAIKWEEEEKVRLSEQSGPTHTVSLLEWATAYLAYSEKKFVFETFAEKKLAFKLLFAFDEVDPGLSVELLKPLPLLNHLHDQEQKRSGNAANKQRKNLRAAWQWGVRFMGLPSSNPFSAVFKFAEERDERYVPPLDDFWKAYDAVDTVSPTEEHQDRLMLLSYLQTGARRDELFRLRWRDVDFEGKRIRLFWRKNAIGQWEEAWLPITDELIDMLRVHQKVTGLQMFVFLNFNNSKNSKDWVSFEYRQHWLGNLCRRAGVKAFGFHGIRHLFASILADDNRPLVEIQHMLRHKSISTTQRYIHQLEKGSRAVLEALPGPDSRSKSPRKAPERQEAL